MELSEALAQQIVDAVYEVVKKDINFIDNTGIIIGSTDPQRLHTFHEAGFEAIRKQIPIEVDSDRQYTGARMGINYPIQLDHESIAAIGISGDPQDMKQFGFLITKITEVFVKEQQLNNQMLTQNRAIYYLVTSLLYHTNLDSRQINSLMTQFSISPTSQYQVLTIKMIAADLEKELNFLFNQLNCPLTAYIYPNEYNAILTESQAKAFWSANASFLQTYKGKLHAGAGPFTNIQEIHRSYKNAKLARRHAEQVETPLCSSEEITMELLTDSIPPDIRHIFTERILSSLTPKDKELLRHYYSNNLSLKKTAANLFIHPNTLQYQLDQIRTKCQLNPRNFPDAAQLYLALLLDKLKIT